MLPFSIHSCLPYPRTLSNRSDRPLRYRWRNPPRFCSLCFGVRFPPKLNVALRRLALFFAPDAARFLLFALRWRVLANARLLFYAGGVPLPLFFVRFLFRVCVWRVLAGGRVWLAFSVFRVRFSAFLFDGFFLQELVLDLLFFVELVLEREILKHRRGGGGGNDWRGGERARRQSADFFPRLRRSPALRANAKVCRTL